MSKATIYLLDIEGTVAPISFVSDVLFPYARAHFHEFLQQNRTDGAVRSDLADLANERAVESDSGAPPCLSDDVECLDYLFWLMDRDRKSTALKSLQGKIWKAGYESGELKGALFHDVPATLGRWAQRARIAIYSSGSVDAQRLFFRYSEFGDLTGYIADYFDTRTGGKRNSASYAAIAARLQVSPSDVIFLSDIVPELDAARDAGCETRLVVRLGNAPSADANGHAVLESFALL